MREITNTLTVISDEAGIAALTATLLERSQLVNKIDAERRGRISYLLNRFNKLRRQLSKEWARLFAFNYPDDILDEDGYIDPDQWVESYWDIDWESTVAIDRYGDPFPCNTLADIDIAYTGYDNLWLFNVQYDTQWKPNTVDVNLFCQELPQGHPYAVYFDSTNEDTDTHEYFCGYTETPTSLINTIDIASSISDGAHTMDEHERQANGKRWMLGAVNPSDWVAVARGINCLTDTELDGQSPRPKGRGL